MATVRGEVVRFENGLVKGSQCCFVGGNTCCQLGGGGGIFGHVCGPCFPPGLLALFLNYVSLAESVDKDGYSLKTEDALEVAVETNVYDR